MLSISLLPQDESRWLGWQDNNPAPALFPAAADIYPLYHQKRTYDAEEPIIVNTYNTGTGKTKAALLRLLKRAQDRGFARLNPTRDNALLIAPTNELLSQHLADAEDFCQKCHLPYRVVQITREKLEQCILLSEEKFNRPKKLHYILNDSSQLDEDTTKRATIFVVNPDIFYYAIYFCYNHIERNSLFDDFFRLFNYIIIDEFHYYSPKQLAAFLFFMKFSHDQGYIDSTSKKRQFCILTATPGSQVQRYLQHLGLPIAWIEPGQPVPTEDSSLIEPVRALAPVQLQIYSTEELQQGKTGEQVGGLLQLVRSKRPQIRQWLDETLDGAIISSSIGMISNIRQALLPYVSDEMIGRITGAELHEQRNMAKECPLILATPTVDIGYNFDRSEQKLRQNIDFLCCDASSGDELIQRMGRAGRVLAKPQKGHVSYVLVVLDPHNYQVLEPYDGQQLERSQLATLALTMAKKNDLYAYVKTGAILEAFRPIKMLKQGMSDQERVQFDAFFAALHRFFADKEDATRPPCTFDRAYKMVAALDQWQACYGSLGSVPQEAFDKLPLLLEQRILWQPETFKDPRTRQCLEIFYQRLKSVGNEAGNDAHAMLRWLQADLQAFYKERARFSFRESFQAPLALVYDPKNIHSSRIVTTYSALQFLRYYHATFYESLDLWQQQTGQTASNLDLDGAVTYCSLHDLREVPLRIGLQVDARAYTRDGWEEQFAYQVTTLYGMELVSLNEHSSLKKSVQSLFRDQYIPAFVVGNDSGSRTRVEMHKLRRQARFFPLPLEVTFMDGRRLPYYAVLGTMAFHVCAELPRWAIMKDRRVTQREDDAPIIC